MNPSPEALEQIGAIPIKTVRGTPVYVRDVANVRDGYAPQTSLVHVGGQKSVLMSVLKQGSASTLDIVKAIRDTLPTTMSPAEGPESIAPLRSVHLRARGGRGGRQGGVHRRGAHRDHAAALPGGWRSTVIVVVSIPLSILVSLIVLHALGQR